MKGWQYGTYVGDTQCRKVVTLAKLGSSHTLASRRTVATQSWRHIRALLARSAARRSSASSGGLVAHARRNVGRAGSPDGSHGVLVRTPGCEMLSVTNTTLDLLVLKLVLELILLAGLLLGVLAPVDTGAEDDVLADRGGVVGRAFAVLCAVAKLGPCLAVGDARVHRLLVGDVADTAGGLDLVAILVDAIGDDGLCAVLVRDRLGRGQFRGRLVDVVVVGPVVPFFDGGVSQGLPAKDFCVAAALTWACLLRRQP